MNDADQRFENLDVHVYPIFRVKLTGMKGTPKEVAEAAEMQVANALNEDNQPTLRRRFNGQCCDIVFAEGFDAACVDVMDPTALVGHQRLESFTVSEMRDTAGQHAETLDSLIDGEDDELGKLLGPIKAFLETVR